MCPINSGAIVIQPECPWICWKQVKDFLESLQYSNLVLLLPSWMCRSQSFSEKSRAPLFANALSNFGLIVSQWTAASVSRSSWSWRTNAVERDPPLYDGQAEIIFHFLSFTGVVLFVKYAGLGEKLIESASSFLEIESEAAPVSWVQVFDVAKQSSLSFAFSCARLIFEMCDSSTNRLFPSGYQNPRSPFWDYMEMRFRFQVHGCQKLVRRELQWLVQWLFSPGIAAWALDSGFARGSVYSRHTGMGSPKPSSSSSLALYLTPADTWYQNDASSQTFVNWTVWDSDSKSWMFSRKLFPVLALVKKPKSSLLVNSRSLAFLCSRILLCREFFLVPSLPLSNRIVHTYSKLSVNTELIHRMNDLDQEFCVWSIRIEVYGFFFLSEFSEFHDSVHWHL